MHKNKNRLAYLIATRLPVSLRLAVAMLCTLPFTGIHAQSLNVNKAADIAFGTIDFTDPTANGDITLGTNGVVTYGTNTSGSGFGTPGQIEVTGTPGTTVSIACDDTGTLALPGTGTLTITPVNFVIGSGNGTLYAGGTTCAGIGTTVATFSLSATSSENIILVGGNLSINAQTLHNGTFSSGNSGGSQPAFRVLVQ